MIPQVLCAWSLLGAAEALVARRASTRSVATARRAAARAPEATQEDVNNAVAWAAENYPDAVPDVADAGEGIVTSAVFWGAVDATKQMPNRECILFFDRSDFPAAKWADMVASLGVEGLQCAHAEGAPLPAVTVRTAWGPEENLGISDEAADASVEALKGWVKDVIVDSKVCPFTKDADVAATGLEAAGVTPGAIIYPVCGAVGSGGAALARVLRAFWGSAIDLLSVSPAEASTVLLGAPAYAEMDHASFVKMTEAVVKTLKHIGAEQELSLVFFHPLYDRAAVEPRDAFTHGHLPPQHWNRAYVALTEGSEVADKLSEGQLKAADAQRRAPFTMINVLRSEQVEAAEKVVPWELIEPEAGRRVRVSGARVYAKNIYRFATESSTKTVDGYSYLVTRKARDALAATDAATAG